MKVALIGFGGLGRIVVEHLRRDENVRLVAVAARAHQADAIHALLPEARVIETPEALIACGPDLVVECASHEAFRQYAEPVLRARLDLIAVSVGVLADAAYRERVLNTAASAGATLEIPAGAIGAIDTIAAARIAGLDRVAYVTRKNAKAWRGTPAADMVSLDTVREPKLFFDETAERAALVFTEKANVCATLAMAGVGFEHTRVQFWLDPQVTKSVHRIEADGPCGTLSIELANNVAADGKASLLTAMSIVRAVRNRSATLRI